MTHPKVLAMARSIAAEQKVGTAPVHIIAGVWDNSPLVKAAIAAIERVTGLAVTLADGWLTVDYDESANCMAGNIRDEIAAFDHLPEPEGPTHA